MTNTNINTAANSGKPEPTRPYQMARTLAPWLKALNTGEAISRQQAPNDCIGTIVVAVMYITAVWLR